MKTPRTSDTTILEVESTSCRSFVPYLCAEGVFEPIFQDMMTQRCSQEPFTLVLESAREQLDAVVALFREMRMTWWLEQAEELRGWIERGDPLRGFALYVDGPPSL